MSRSPSRPQRGQRAPRLPLAWDPPTPLHVYWAGQDDPKKNTAKRLAKHALIHIHDQPRDLPGGAILLDPMAKKAISREDAPRAAKKGIAAIDCSWEHVQATYLGQRKRMEPRALPYLVAGNPTKYGQPFVLSTAEAIAAALHIMGWTDDAHQLMAVFPWGKTFFDVNREPLDDYTACATSEEIVEAQQAFMPDDTE